MKKNMYILVSGLIAITFLFGSCKSLTNLSIEKRQHRGGYYVDWGNGKVKTDPAKNTTAKAKQSKETPKTSATAKKAKPAGNSETTAATEQKSKEATTTVNNDAPKKVHTTSTFKVKEEAVAQRESAAKKTTNSFSYTFSDNDKTKPDMPDWAWILLCLIPPLAVGLWFDGITTEFWISLILTLLFWLPGFIYAIIIIF